MKNVNYTPEMTAKIVELYLHGDSGNDIASAIDKSVRPVRSKLVREGVSLSSCGFQKTQL